MPPPNAQDGAKDLTQVMKKWKPWLPPKANQGLQQGGCVVFKGRDAALEHLDEVRVSYAPGVNDAWHARTRSPYWGQSVSS
jgi:hypothetical protein